MPHSFGSGEKVASAHRRGLSAVGAVLALGIALGIGLFSGQVSAQNNRHDNEWWAGYLASLRLSDRFGLWTDAHYISEAAFIIRPGLTYIPEERIRLTAGYAWVTTSTPYSKQLIRPEHRPWAHLLYRQPFSEGFVWQLRMRYDARFRRELNGQEVLSSRIFYHRFRWMGSLRAPLRDWGQAGSLHLNLVDELLLNAGPNAPALFEQNRLYVMTGYSRGPITLQAGPHWRVIQGAGDNFNYRYGATLWVFHNMDLRGRKAAEPVPPDQQILGN